MLRIERPAPRLCDGLDRRRWLRLGSLALGGLNLPNLLAQRAAAGTAGKARSVILFFLTGGPPQMDIWDPKPEGPSETRGSFGAIATRTPGYHVGSLLPLTAQWTDKLAVLRAVVTHDNAHSSSGYQVMTGTPHLPLSQENAVAVAPNFAPHMGATLQALRPGSGLPGAIALPRRIANVGEIVWPGQTAGYLGKQYDPWILTCDPAAEKMNVPDLALPQEVPALRFDQRRRLLDQVNDHFQQLEATGATRRYDQQSSQALALLGTERARGAFDLNQEDPKLRDRYGRTPWGQSVLLSRRLVEAGVSLVQINWPRIEGRKNHGGWDTHEAHEECMGEFLMPMMDQAFSALLTDLSERGLLDETIILWLGEFGRTPKINPKAGRDHWGRASSLALAGGGIRGGTIYGSTDSQAAEPVADAVEPKDIIATIFHLLGYPSETVVHDTLGRPVPVSRGRVIEAIV